MKYIQIQITTPSKPVAQKIGAALLEKQLAACVQIIGPIESHYIWQDQIETAGEYLCLIKAESQYYERIEKVICNMHPYEVPEIIQLNIEGGYLPYLNWISYPTAE